MAFFLIKFNYYYVMHAISPRWKVKINDTFNILNYIVVCPKVF